LTHTENRRVISSGRTIDKSRKAAALPQVRSVNLASCVTIVAYEAIRKWGGNVA